MSCAIFVRDGATVSGEFRSDKPGGHLGCGAIHFRNKSSDSVVFDDIATVRALRSACEEILKKHDALTQSNDSTEDTPVVVERKEMQNVS